MAPRASVRLRPRKPRAPVPALENGDRLTRVEFERRYEAMPEGMKAELIDGVVYMSSPAKNEHGSPWFLLATWLGHYAAATPGTSGGGDGTVRLDERSEPQPDVHLRLAPEAGGRARVDEDGYVSGPVELACEVCASSASYDLHVKKALYERAGIREYLALAVRTREVFWFALEDGEYRELRCPKDGVVRSRVFPGLWLDTRALLANDLPRVLATLAQGIASGEHAAFVRVLRARRRRRG